MPWQRTCYTARSGIGPPLSGHCLTTNGWATTAAAVAAVAALALLIVIRRHPETAIELAAALGLLVATVGFRLENGSGPGFDVGRAYGSTVSFVGAALLIALALARVRPRRVALHHLHRRLAPIAACAAYVAVLVLPWWDVLPRRTNSALFFAPLSWLTIAGALVGIHLLFLWFRRVADNADWLVGLPLFLLALAAVDLIAERSRGISWGGGIIVGLSLVLALIGYVEQQGGLRNLRLPEIMRVDRIEP